MPKPHQVTVRSTRQARAVAAVLPTLPGFRSGPEIHAALRGVGERIGVATVYRQLRLLAGQGSLDTHPRRRRRDAVLASAGSRPGAAAQAASPAWPTPSSCPACPRARGPGDP